MLNPDVKANQITNDPIVNEVIDIICQRHAKGMEKFGKTMEANDKPFDHWIDNTIEELIDAIHYLVKSRTIVEKFKSKNVSLEKMFKEFKEETFKAVTKQTLPPGTQPGGADWVEPTAEELKDATDQHERNEEKVSSENWYETQGVKPPPKGNKENGDKEKDKT